MDPERATLTVSNEGHSSKDVSRRIRGEHNHNHDVMKNVRPEQSSTSARLGAARQE